MKPSPSLPVWPLTPDMATISAIATDHGFEEVYAKQIVRLGQPGDILVVICRRPQPQPDRPPRTPSPAT